MAAFVDDPDMIIHKKSQMQLPGYITIGDDPIKPNIICTIARMNPPTPGHLIVVMVLILQAIHYGITDIYVILSETTLKDDNPITCIAKVNILSEDSQFNMTSRLKIKMQESGLASPEQLAQIKVNYICSANPFSTIGALIYTKRDQLNIHKPDKLQVLIIIGDDRAVLCERIKSSYGVNVTGIILNREGMSNYKDKTRLDIEGMTEFNNSSISASFIRKLVAYGFKGQFNSIYNDYLDETTIDILYEQIQQGFIDAAEAAELEKTRKIDERLAKASAKASAKSKTPAKTTKKTGAKTRKNRKKGSESSSESSPNEEA